MIVSYRIQPILPEIRKTLTIDEAEYTEITHTRKLAWDILLVKELFSYLVRNYNHLETEIQRIETEANNDSDKLMEKLFSGSFRLDNSHICNLLVMNLLTTCRSYLELFYYQNKNEKREIFSRENDIRNTLENIKKKHHDQNTICSFFWNLRNYAQHDCSPITGSPTAINNQITKIGFTTNVNKILKQSDEIQELKIYIETESPDYSQQELQKYPKHLNIRILLKEYILLMKNLNDEFNKKLDSRFQNVKNILSKKVEHYCHDNSPESAFEIYKLTEDSREFEERFDVSLQLISDWEKTIEKYSRINQINDQFNLS